jgi:hypothetical protein
MFDHFPMIQLGLVPQKESDSTAELPAWIIEQAAATEAHKNMILEATIPLRCFDSRLETKSAPKPVMNQMQSITILL